ncbi:hypothetical protein, partial [Agromyces humi]|uniref:hypothetical protein n=1 Tax=Agromyces humi TaxID=1766800 RepID=UPI0013597617
DTYVAKLDALDAWIRENVDPVPALDADLVAYFEGGQVEAADGSTDAAGRGPVTVTAAAASVATMN